MTFRSLMLAAAIAAAASGPALAHHSFAMFDFTKPTTWVGTVEEFEWANPHSRITIVVPPTSKDQATVGRWAIEGQSTNIMRRQGWGKTTLKPGDKVTVVGYPTRDGTKAGSLYYVLVNGKEMYGDPNRHGGPLALGGPQGGGQSAAPKPN